MKEGNSDNDYRLYWDKQYLQDYYISKRGSLWDVDVEDSIEQDFKLFKNYLNERLAIIDIGCGTGKISSFLCDQYSNVLGIDISKRAISIARRTYNRKGLNFEVKNIMDQAHLEDIKRQLGEVNIYIRGVLHQLEDKDRIVFIKHLAELLGEKGRLVLHEVKEGLYQYLTERIGTDQDLPGQMLEVFETQFPPKGMSVNLLDDYFREPWNRLMFEEKHLASNLRLTNDRKLEVPSVFAVYSYEGKEIE